MALVDHFIRTIEQRGIQQLDQHPETEMVSLMRCGREQQQVTGMVAQRLCEFVIFCFADPPAHSVSREMVRLVKDHQIPRRRFLEPLNARTAFECVHAGDQAVVLGKGIAPADR